MAKVIPFLIQGKYGMDIRSAIARKLDMLSADSMRKGLNSMPPVWLDENDLDALLLNVTKEYGYDWWAEDERGGSRGLLSNQKYSYVKVTREPVVLPLKNPYHALF
jgi:hypothetical protein